MRWGKFCWVKVISQGQARPRVGRARVIHQGKFCWLKGLRPLHGRGPGRECTMVVCQGKARPRAARGLGKLCWLLPLPVRGLGRGLARVKLRRVHPAGAALLDSRIEARAHATQAPTPVQVCTTRVVLIYACSAVAALRLMRSTTLAKIVTGGWGPWQFLHRYFAVEVVGILWASSAFPAPLLASPALKSARVC